MAQKNIIEVKQALNRLNFGKLISIDSKSVENYSFQEYAENNCKHIIKGFCTICEKDHDKSCSLSKDQKSHLTTVSHGMHSYDLFDASSFIPGDGWHDDPIVFILENPGPKHSFFQKQEFNGVMKFPAEEWYFVHERKTKLPEFPEYFRSGQYGDLFHSIINTFKLKNAYFTNFVKCGIIDNDGKFINSLGNSEKSILNCRDNYLYKELEIMSPKIVFVFGQRTHRLVTKYTDIDSSKIVRLSHPAYGSDKKEYYDVIKTRLEIEGII